jgi:hypothetical protein
MCIYWKATLYTFTADTLNSDFRTQTHKRKLFSQGKLGYISVANKICTFTVDKLISKFSHMKKKKKSLRLNIQETRVKSKVYTILTNSGETISNSQYTATA